MPCSTASTFHQHRVSTMLQLLKRTHEARKQTSPLRSAQSHAICRPPFLSSPLRCRLIVMDAARPSPPPLGAAVRLVYAAFPSSLSHTSPVCSPALLGKALVTVRASCARSRYTGRRWWPARRHCESGARRSTRCQTDTSGMTLRTLHAGVCTYCDGVLCTGLSIGHVM